MKEEKKDLVALHVGTHFVRSVSPVALSLGASIVSHLGRSGALAASVEDGTDFRLPADEVAAPLFVGSNVGTGPDLPPGRAHVVTDGDLRVWGKAYLDNMEAGQKLDLERLESIIVDWYGSTQNGSAQESSKPKLNLFCRSVHFENFVSLDSEQTFSDNSLQHRVGVVEGFFACPAREVNGYQNIGSVGPVDQDTLQNIYTALHDTIVKKAGRRLMIALIASNDSRKDVARSSNWDYDEDQMPYLHLATGKKPITREFEKAEIYDHEFSSVIRAFRNNGDVILEDPAMKPVQIVSTDTEGNAAGGNNFGGLAQHVLPQSLDWTPHVGNVTGKKLVYVETTDSTCKQLVEMKAFDNVVYRALDYCKPTQKFVTVKKNSLHCEKCTDLNLFASCQLDKKTLDKQTVSVTMIFRRPNGIKNRPGLDVEANPPLQNNRNPQEEYAAHRSILPSENTSMCGGRLHKLDQDKHLCTTAQGLVWPNRPNDLPPANWNQQNVVGKAYTTVTGLPVTKEYPIFRPPLKPSNWLTNKTKFIEFADKKTRMHLRIGLSGTEVYPIFASNNSSNCSGMSLDRKDEVYDIIIQNLKSQGHALICVPTFKGSKVVLPQLTKGGKSVESFLKDGNNEQSVPKSPGIEPKQNDTEETSGPVVLKKKDKKRSHKSRSRSQKGKSRRRTHKTHKKATDSRGRRRKARRTGRKTYQTHPKTSKRGKSAGRRSKRSNK